MSQLRRIFIPRTVNMKLQGQFRSDGTPFTRPISFFAFLEDNVFSDGQKMGNKAPEIRKALKVLDEFEAAQKRAELKAGSGDWPRDVYVDVTTEMWDKMVAICNEPSGAGGPGGWNPYYFKQLLTFVDAITEAPLAPEPPPSEAPSPTPAPAN